MSVIHIGIQQKLFLEMILTVFILKPEIGDISVMDMYI